MLFLYNLFLVFYRLGIQLVAVWNPKARLWVEGRKSIFDRLQAACTQDTRPTVWFHCASLGEFEQGRPLIEAIRLNYPQYKILLTFFSPSGFEVQKNYPGADLVFYLPLDHRQSSHAFVKIAKPSLAIFVKYESWYHYLKALKESAVPTLLVSAIFRPTQHFFGPFGTFFRSMLEQYSQIFLQDSHSATTLTKAGIRIPTQVAGDTRFDRVTRVAAQYFEHQTIEKFSAGQDLLVAGSTWPEDEALLNILLDKIPSLNLVIAPHNIDEHHLKKTERSFANSVRLSEWEEKFRPNETRVMIIDQIGILSMIYRYSTFCYVGGGFNRAGIHNILEAAVYGRAVVFGPSHEQAAEASALIELGAGFSVASADKLVELAKKMTKDPAWSIKNNQLAENFVRERTGATMRIMDFIAEKDILVKNKVL
jgi:3-deoxy-D-manno-octulosonic-acid transferase